MKHIQISHKRLARGSSQQLILGLACASLVGLALPVLAQHASEYESTQPSSESEPDGQLRFGVGLGHRFESDLDDGGKSDETALRGTVAANYRVSDKSKLGIALSYQYSHYDFSEMAVADPWNDVHIVRVTPLYQYAIDETWSVYGGPSFALAAESGADIDDSFTGGGLAGFNYRANEAFSIGGGIGIFSQLEEEARLVPFVTLNWRVDDEWLVRAGFTEVAGNGGWGAEVTCDLVNNWKVGGGLALIQKRFRLEDNGATQGGVGQDRNIPIYAKVGWAPCPKASLELVAGIAVGGEYRVEDSQGHKVGNNTDYDAAALLGVRALFQF